MDPLTIFLSIFIVVGAVVSLLGLRSIANAYASRNWKSTEGKITSSEIKTNLGGESGTSHKPAINYEYKIQGERKKGDLVAFGIGYFSGYRSYAKSTIKKYHKGKTVKVYYDESKSDRSVLEPGLQLKSFIPLIGGLLFILLPLVILVVNKSIDK